MKIVSIVGARPQFIKCAPLSRVLRVDHDEILVHTGQHYDDKMSDIFFKDLGIPKPNYNLNIGSCSHGEQTGKILSEVEKVLIKENPDMVLVYGDTNSTLAGALAAAKLHIKIAHIEAGLRSFDRRMPEEVNRVVTDHISNLLFCPTETAMINLKNEGITEGVYNVGDVMVDALNYNLRIAEKKSSILSDLNLERKEYILATVHRPSNTDSSKNLSSIVNVFCNSSWPIVFPVHPRTEKYLKEYGLWSILCQKVKVIPPVGYIDMLSLMASSRKIMTDSGGIQKEAYMLGVPCITLRENTEWVETVTEGWNVLVGTDSGMIAEAMNGFEGADVKGNVFGQGNASKSICKFLST